MKKDYRVIALDMDGTVLNDKKKIGERTRQAIHKALAAGKEVVFCSGRSYDEMTEYLEEFPDMHYLCLESGALLADHRKKEILDMISIAPDTVQQIKNVIAGRDILPQIFSNGRSLMNRSQMTQLEHFHLTAFKELYDNYATPVDDVFAVVESEKSSAEKINLFHASTEDREITKKILTDLQLPVTLVYSETASLECSAPDISKAVGLRSLCRILNITMDQVIMVGDANNDRTALEAAGLAVAMGNAHPWIKEICDVQVADNNHDGCAEAIEKYLL